jgi:hypothetical protein
LAAALTGGAAYQTAAWLLTLFPPTNFPYKFIVVAGGGAAGLLAYLLMVFLLNITEARSLRQLLSRRVNS